MPRSTKSEPVDQPSGRALTTTLGMDSAPAPGPKPAEVGAGAQVGTPPWVDAAVPAGHSQVGKPPFTT